MNGSEFVGVINAFEIALAKFVPADAEQWNQKLEVWGSLAILRGTIMRKLNGITVEEEDDLPF